MPTFHGLQMRKLNLREVKCLTQNYAGRKQKRIQTQNCLPPESVFFLEAPTSVKPAKVNQGIDSTVPLPRAGFRWKVAGGQG